MNLRRGTARRRARDAHGRLAACRAEVLRVELPVHHSTRLKIGWHLQSSVMARPRGVSNVLPRLSTCMLTYSSSWESGSDGGKRSAQAKDIDIDLCLIGSGSASSLLEDDGASAVTRFDEREHRPGGIMSPYSAGGLRLLAPAHSGQGAHSSSNSSSSSGGGAGPARAKKASTACSACQRRRSKVSPAPPGLLGRLARSRTPRIGGRKGADAS